LSVVSVDHRDINLCYLACGLFAEANTPAPMDVDDDTKGAAEPEKEDKKSVSKANLYNLLEVEIYHVLSLVFLPLKSYINSNK